MQYLKLHIGLITYIICLYVGVNSSKLIKHVGDDMSLSCLECRFSASSAIDIQVVHLPIPADNTGDIVLTVNPSTLQLTVSPDYTPRVEFSGSLDRLDIRFIMRNVSKSDAGAYKCSQGLSAACKSMLIIVDSPEKPIITSSEPAVVNHNVTLTCSARSQSMPEGHGLIMSYKWNLPIQDGRYLVNGERVSFAVSMDDQNDLFRCSATEEGLVSEESDTFTISVEYKPRTLRFDPDVTSRTVAVGSVLDVVCTADCRPRCGLSWVNQRTRVPVASGNNTLFKIGRVQRRHHGNYSCTVENRYGSLARDLFIDVLYSPIVITDVRRNNLSDELQRVNENDSVAIMCHVDSHPAPVVKWYRHGDDTPFLSDDFAGKAPQVYVKEEITHHEYTSRYEISRASCSDYGEYYCHADNAVGNPVNGVSWQLTVQCVPQLSSRSHFAYTFGKENGKPLIIDLDLESYPRPTDYRLYRLVRGQRIEAHAEVRPINPAVLYRMTFRLTFRVDVRLGVEMYSFYVKNDGGSTFIDFNVTLIGPPLAPTQFVVEPGSDSFNLYWLPGYHGGFPQSFVLAYKTGVDAEWVSRTVKHEVIDTEETNMTAVARGFHSGTDYFVRLYATNVKGLSRPTDVIRVTTLPAPLSEAGAGMIAGIIIAVIIVIIIIIIIIVIFIRRKRQKKASDVETSVEYTKPFLGESRGKPDGATEDEKHPSVEDLYTEVRKNPKMTDTETPYENVDKVHNEEKDEKPEENEEAPLIPEKRFKPEEVLPSNNNEVPPKQEGVLYSDLDFSESPRETTETPTVHGGENVTPYDTIDFSKTAPPGEPVQEEDNSPYESVEVKK